VSPPSPARGPSTADCVAGLFPAWRRLVDRAGIRVVAVASRRSSPGRRDIRAGQVNKVSRAKASRFMCLLYPWKYRRRSVVPTPTDPRIHNRATNPSSERPSFRRVRTRTVSSTDGSCVISPPGTAHEDDARDAGSLRRRAFERPDPSAARGRGRGPCPGRAGRPAWP